MVQSTRTKKKREDLETRNCALSSVAERRAVLLLSSVTSGITLPSRRPDDCPWTLWGPGRKADIIRVLLREHREMHGRTGGRVREPSAAVHHQRDIRP